MSAVTAQDSGAMHPMSTTRKTTPAPVPKRKITKGIPLYTVTDTDQQREAIETAVETCANTGRPVRTVNTPNGPKKAIVMTDSKLTSTCDTYLMRASRALREYCNVWSSPILHSSFPASVTPMISNRATYISKLFAWYTSHCVIRLISKPPLFQSQRFWVSWDPEDESYDSVGFDWNPAENNEVYVVVPWSSLNHVLSTATLPTLECGKLFITPVTELVTEDGLPTTLNITSMCAPVDLDFFVPQNPPSIKKTKSVTIVEAREEVQNSISWLYEHGQKNRKTAPDFWIFDDIEKPGLFKCVATYDGFMQEAWGRTKAIAKYAAADKVVVKLIEQSLSGFDPRFCCIEKCFRAPTLQVDGIACDECESYSYCRCACKTHKKSISAQEQIFEYSYDSESTQAVADYGKTTDTSDRANHHWQKVESKVVSSGTNQTFSFNFQNLGKTTATLEAQRHLFMSKMPTFKLTATTNPSSSALYRVTCNTDVPAHLLDFPGVEWDVKSGELLFSPYWLYQQSAVSKGNLNLNINLQFLTGAVGTNYHLTLWVNTSPIEYHHMDDSTGFVLAEEQGQSIDHSELPEDAKKFADAVDAQIERNTSNTADSDPGSGDIEGVSHVTASTNEVNQAEAIGVTQSERDWRLVKTISIDPVATAVVNIALTSSIFGKFCWYTARRYFKWKGAPRLKIQTTSASTTNAQVFYVQSDNEITSADKVERIPFILPASKASINEGAIEMELKWRCPTPTLHVNPHLSDSILGWLNVCIPNYTKPLVNGAHNNIQVAIYCDTSNVEYSHPTSKYINSEWADPVIKETPRTVLPSTMGGTVQSVISDDEGNFPSIVAGSVVGIKFPTDAMDLTFWDDDEILILDVTIHGSTMNGSVLNPTQMISHVRGNNSDPVKGVVIYYATGPGEEVLVSPRDYRVPYIAQFCPIASNAYIPPSFRLS